VRLFQVARLALDMEQRMTPWHWCRHAQLVAEDAVDGAILGYVEVWAEDAASLQNLSAVTPQPVLFNLCVAPNARRSGVARDLVRECEAQCSSWGEDNLFLKVRGDNRPALQLYEREGFEPLGLRAPPSLPAWQERWKGGVGPLQLMQKDWSGSSPPESQLARAQARTSAPKPKSARDFVVSIEQVLEYEDRDALIWYALLLFRNQKPLPANRLLPVLAAVATSAAWVSFWSLLRDI